MYALLTGLNAATVGVVALAAVQLSQKAITDKLTRVLVFLGGTAGMLYNALWYFPILMLAGGISTVVWDYRWVHQLLRKFKRREEAIDPDSEAHAESVGMNVVSSELPVRRSRQQIGQPDQISSVNDTATQPEDTVRIGPPQREIRILSWKLGITVIACFFGIFTAIMALRGTLHDAPRGFNLFANLFLAGILVRDMIHIDV